MIIPQSFRIGTKRYKVEMQENSNKKLGTIVPAGQRIIVYKQYKFIPRTPAEMAGTFWHEVTHAILWEMDHPRWKDEKFVVEFSKRLNQVVHTAKLES